jgi:hypothetical protein
MASFIRRLSLRGTVTAPRARWIPVVLLVLGVTAFALFIPRAMISGNGATERKLENDLRTTLIQGFGLLGLAVTATVGWRSLMLSREGQVTERYTRAVDLLGHDNADVRLGGIYALKRIAEDSPDRDHATIMEVLTGYVRVHATTAEARREDRVLVDVQAALSVLGLRRVGNDPEDFTPYLNRVHIPQARLRDIDLKRARMREVDLQEALLSRADLTEASLKRAKLNRAHLQGAHLERAELRGAELRAAELQGAFLQDADLTGADLTGAVYDAETDWPAGFDAKAAGAKPAVARGRRS